MQDTDISLRTNKAAELLKTLAHPLRMQTALVLTQQESINVTALQILLKTEQSLLSHHLIKMKDRGILTSTRKGKELYYSLADPNFVKAVKVLLASSLIS